MSCNCKKTAANAGKYSEDGTGVEIVKGIKRIPIFILRFALAFLALGLIIVILPFFLIWIVFKLIIGREIKIDLNKLLRINEKRKYKLQDKDRDRE